eukprot:scaffold312473_cov17-Tisochrysis_lutea.AAC.1
MLGMSPPPPPLPPMPIPALLCGWPPLLGKAPPSNSGKQGRAAEQRCARLWHLSCPEHKPGADSLQRKCARIAQGHKCT